MIFMGGMNHGGQQQGIQHRIDKLDAGLGFFQLQKAHIKGGIVGHQNRIFDELMKLGQDLVDEWLCGQNVEDFTQMLPLLRRAFSSFDASSGKRLLDRVRVGQASPASVVLDDPRAVAAFAAAVPLLVTILGVGDDE